LSVAWPEAFWFAPVLLLFYPLWRWREKQRPTLPYPDTRFLQVTASHRVWLARWLPLLGRWLVGVLLLLALANPRWPVPGSQIPSEGIALMFVLDVSGSMAERDVLLDGQPVTRLQAACSVLKRYLAGSGASARGNDAIGLVTFALRPIDVCPPTLSHASVEYFLNQAQPIGTVPDSSTNIGDAMGVAVDLLRRSGLKSQLMVLISDGEHPVPSEIDKDALKPRQAAQLAAAFGIRVHTIFLSGSPGGDATKLAEQRRAEATLRSVSEMTQGQASLASDGDSLALISQKLDTLEKSRITSFLYTEYLEGRPWLLALALVVLCATIVLEETWFRVVP